MLFFSCLCQAFRNQSEAKLMAKWRLMTQVVSKQALSVQPLQPPPSREEVHLWLLALSAYPFGGFDVLMPQVKRPSPEG
jgi:hypothetical protein